MDAFGTDEGDLRHSVIGSWVICFPTNSSHWTDVRYLAPWWVFSAGCQFMVLVHLGVLSRQENRCVLTYLWCMCHSNDLISLLGVGTVPRNLIAYQMIRLRWGASQVTATARNMPVPYPIWGLRSSLGASSLSRSYLLSRLWTPLGRYPGGGRIGGSPAPAKVVLSALFRLSFLSPPLFFLLVEVENPCKPVAPNDLSTPRTIFDTCPREMPQLVVSTKP
jgi:hypothetical protein